MIAWIKGHRVFNLAAWRLLFNIIQTPFGRLNPQVLSHPTGSTSKFPMLSNFHERHTYSLRSQVLKIMSFELRNNNLLIRSVHSTNQTPNVYVSNIHKCIRKANRSEHPFGWTAPTTLRMHKWMHNYFYWILITEYRFQASNRIASNRESKYMCIWFIMSLVELIIRFVRSWLAWMNAGKINQIQRVRRRFLLGFLCFTYICFPDMMVVDFYETVCYVT